MASLIDLVTEDYRNLQKLDPGNELLKYWVMDNEVLKSKSDPNLSVEFLDRFGPPETLKQECKSFDEYHTKFSLILLGNYSLALKSTINFITNKDITSSIN